MVLEFWLINVPKNRLLWDRVLAAFVPWGDLQQFMQEEQLHRRFVFLRESDAEEQALELKAMGVTVELGHYIVRQDEQAATG